MFGKRGIDVSQADLRVMHGVLYVRGVVSGMRGFDFGQLSLSESVDQVANILRKRPDVRDVSLSCYFKGDVKS